MRFFLELSFKGTRYAGWQRQANAITVQEKLEESLSLALREPVSLTGCGRTDTGVHARKFYAHFDFPKAISDTFLKHVNRLLPPDIFVARCWQVDDKAHARFDAIRRTYEYHISRIKNPFREDTIYHFPNFDKVDTDRMEQVSEIIKQYNVFFPLSKSRSDVNHYACDIFESGWHMEDDVWIYTISANRFLRGMVRLIVGLSLYAGRGKISISAVREALETQTRISGIWAVPPLGLFLTRVEYPFSLPGAVARKGGSLP